jgi:hypothetical protein
LWRERKKYGLQQKGFEVLLLSSTFPPVVHILVSICSLFGWLVADDWCWFLLREEYYWLVAGGLFVLREKYCWLVADKPGEQGDGPTNYLAS